MSFTFEEISSEINSISSYFSSLSSSLCGVGAPFNARVFEIAQECHKYVYGREVPSIGVNGLCELSGYLAELGEMFEVECPALTDMSEKCEIYIEYDQKGCMELEDVATILNTTEECLEETLKPDDLFYVEDKIYCLKSSVLMNDPRFVKLTLPLDLMIDD